MSHNLSPDSKPRYIGSHYYLERTVGEGAFGKVSLGVHIHTKEPVAIKTMEKDRIKDQADVERIAREIHILKKLRHPHVIQLYDVLETDPELHLIMEYAPGGELFEYIVSNSRLEEPEACRFYHQLISGIEYIHQQRVVHRDLKPENLLLDAYKNLKIADFGLGNSYSQQGDLLKTACGSPCYAAPEMIAGKKYNGLAVDIWSSGIVLFAMVCGFLPFEDPDTSLLYQKIMDGKFEVPSHLSDEAVDLLSRVLNVDPEKRWGIDEIRSHRWMRGLKDERMIRVKEIKGVYNSELNEKVAEMVEGYNIQRKDLIKNLKENKHNNITATYYLLLNKEVRLINEKLESIIAQNMQESVERPTRHKTWGGKKNKGLIKEQNKNRKLTIQPQTKVPLEEIFRKINSFDPDASQDSESFVEHPESSIELSKGKEATLFQKNSFDSLRKVSEDKDEKMTHKETFDSTAKSQENNGMTTPLNRGKVSGIDSQEEPVNIDIEGKVIAFEEIKDKHKKSWSPSKEKVGGMREKSRSQEQKEKIEDREDNMFHKEREDRKDNNEEKREVEKEINEENEAKIEEELVKVDGNNDHNNGDMGLTTIAEGKVAIENALKEGETVEDEKKDRNSGLEDGKNEEETLAKENEEVGGENELKSLDNKEDKVAVEKNSIVQNEKESQQQGTEREITMVEPQEKTSQNILEKARKNQEQEKEQNLKEEDKNIHQEGSNQELIEKEKENQERDNKKDIKEDETKIQQEKQSQDFIEDQGNQMIQPQENLKTIDDHKKEENIKETIENNKSEVEEKSKEDRKPSLFDLKNDTPKEVSQQETIIQDNKPGQETQELNNEKNLTEKVAQTKNQEENNLKKEEEELNELEREEAEIREIEAQIKALEEQEVEEKTRSHGYTIRIGESVAEGYKLQEIREMRLSVMNAETYFQKMQVENIESELNSPQKQEVSKEDDEKVEDFKENRENKIEAMKQNDDKVGGLEEKNRESERNSTENERNIDKRIEGTENHEENDRKVTVLDEKREDSKRKSTENNRNEKFIDNRMEETGNSKENDEKMTVLDGKKEDFKRKSMENGDNTLELTENPQEKTGKVVVFNGKEPKSDKSEENSKEKDENNRNTDDKTKVSEQIEGKPLLKTEETPISDDKRINDEKMAQVSVENPLKTDSMIAKGKQTQAAKANKSRAKTELLAHKNEALAEKGVKGEKKNERIWDKTDKYNEKNRTPAKINEKEAKFGVKEARKVTKSEVKEAKSEVKENKVESNQAAKSGLKETKDEKIVEKEVKTVENEVKNVENEVKTVEKEAKTEVKTVEKEAKTIEKEAEIDEKDQEKVVQTLETQAKTSENNAKTLEKDAKASETQRKPSEHHRKSSETHAKPSETHPKSSEIHSKPSEKDGKLSEKIRAQSPTTRFLTNVQQNLAKKGPISHNKNEIPELPEKQNSGKKRADEEKTNKLQKESKKMVPKDKIAVKSRFMDPPRKKPENLASKPIKEDYSHENSLEKHPPAKPKKAPSNSRDPDLLERVYDILRKDRMIYKKIGLTIHKEKETMQNKHKHSISLHSNAQTERKRTAPRTDEKRKLNSSVVEDNRRKPPVTRSIDESIDRKRDFRMTSAERAPIKNKNIVKVINSKNTKAIMDRIDPAEKSAPKEHQGPIEIKSLTTKTKEALNSELNKALNIMNLQALKASPDTYRVLSDDLEMVIQVGVNESMKGLSTIGFRFNSGKKEAYARVCTEILRFLKI